MNSSLLVFGFAQTDSQPSPTFRPSIIQEIASGNYCPRNDSNFSFVILPALSIAEGTPSPSIPLGMG
jgi:hypothetical protein